MVAEGKMKVQTSFWVLFEYNYSILYNKHFGALTTYDQIP